MNGKLQIIAAILKLDRQFRISHICDVTGIDRNLVRYHIVRFTEQGLLEKYDKYFIIRDREGLLNAMVDSAEKTETTKMKVSGFFTDKFVKTVNTQAEGIVTARSLELPMSVQAKTSYVDKIDQSIRELKNLRKYLNNSTKTVGSAAKFLKQENGLEEWLWNLLIHNGGEGCDLEEFKVAIKYALKADDE